MSEGRREVADVKTGSKGVELRQLNCWVAGLRLAASS